LSASVPWPAFGHSIGLRYLAMVAPTVALGYVLERKLGHPSRL